MSGGLATWPDQRSYVDVKRARLIRFDIESEREFSALDTPTTPPPPAAVPPALQPDLPRDEAGPAEPLHLPCRVCGAIPARRHLNGWLCTLHAPVVPLPDPSRDATALAAGRRYTA